MDEKIKLLKNVKLFAQLRDLELDVIARYSEFLDYKEGKIIFKEGSFVDELYIVKKGKVLITKRTSETEERDIARFLPGESFGELNLFDKRALNATAITEKDSRILIFPMRGMTLTDILEKHPDIFAQIFHKLLAIISSRIRQTNMLISEKSQWIENLKKQMFSDKLTGLYNRKFIEEDFVLHFHDYGANISLLVIKPDNFKYINDSFGHEVGDKILRLLADVVKSFLRDTDMTVRYRGNEFIAILPNTDKDIAEKIARGLKKDISAIEAEEITGGKSLNITASIGISTYPLHATEYVSLIDKAYEKMWEARNRGGNKVLCD